MKRIQITFLSLICLFVTACGQPGPLYLPKDKAPAQAQPEEKTDKSQDLAAPPEKADSETATPKEPSQ